MRTISFLVLLVFLPAFALSQSLAEVAKKEKERREQNKRAGKEAIVLTEEALPEEEEAEGEEGEQGAAPRETRSSTRTATGEESSYDDESGDVPTSIPADAPLETRIAMFARMKTDYERQVREIDEQIAKNETRIQALEAEIGATSALGGGGLPVAPQTGTGAATRPMTGQESAALVGEQNRLKAENEGLERKKEQLKSSLLSKGRRAGIPAGHLRF